MSEHQAYLRQRKQYKLKINVTQIFLLVFVLAIWEIAGRMGWIDPFIMSQPSRIIKTIINLSKDGSIFLHTGVTLYETVVGFLAGTVFGTITAIMLWWSDFLARVLDPYLVVLNALPKTALGPVILVWIGGTTKWPC